MKMTIGIKQKEGWIMMECFIWTLMEIRAILYCFMKMPGDIVKLIYGVCIIKMNTFIFLLPALLGGLNLGPQRSLLTPRTPPGTPHNRRPTDEARNKQRRQALGLANGSQRSDDDDDEEKENHQDPRDSGDSLLDDLLSRLLKKWEEAIDQLEQQISQDLKGFKRRLGIRQ
ncbi:E4 [Human papillomavirus type 216]|uniref:E4 n=1 Tax=Human papillomavirus type 216 TaxID=2060140 RepID=A0A2R4QL95_9PAPI|nr:E4 [Human papillomavirus type 216]